MVFPNITDMMKNAKAMQEKIQAMQLEFAGREFCGQAGAGLVRVTIKGQAHVSKVEIDAALLREQDKQILEDLLCAAFNEASRKAAEAMNIKMAEMTGNLGLPFDFKLPF